VQHFLKTFEGVESADTGFLIDALIDVEDLLHPDQHMLTMLDSSAQIQYPPGEPLAASVISLPDPDVASKDPFLEVLASSYNGVKRGPTTTGAVGFNERRRLSLIDRKDRVLYIEFPNELEYWKMVQAIIGSLKDYDAVYVCKSTWPRKEVTRETAIFTSSPAYITCQVHNGALTFNSGKDSEIIDLHELKALTVSWDYEKVTECILKTSFYLVGNLTKLHATVHLESPDLSRDERPRPMALSESESGAVRLKSRSILEKSKLRVHIFPGQDSHDAGDVTEADKFGSLEISLADLKSSLPKVSKIPLEVPLSHRAVRVVIHSAVGLQPTTHDREPSPYCSVYLLSKYQSFID
jgi:hypothetical protein